MKSSLQDMQRGIYNIPLGVTEKGFAMSEVYGLSIDEVAQKLAYDSDAGIFTWVVPASRNVPAGSIAGCDKATRTGNDGQKVFYRYIRINGISIPAAKLAWALYYGEWPQSRICFRDNDTLNLRIGNLYESNGVKSPTGFSNRAAYLQAHREAHPVAWKNSYLTQSYGIDMNEYLAMAIAQGNKCAICNREERIMRNGKIKSLAVDHNHKTGKVRALLCDACNKAIGMMEENKEILLSAVRYLDKYSEDSRNVIPLSQGDSPMAINTELTEACSNG